MLRMAGDQAAASAPSNRCARRRAETRGEQQTGLEQATSRAWLGAEVSQLPGRNGTVGPADLRVAWRLIVRQKNLRRGQIPVPNLALAGPPDTGQDQTRRKEKNSNRNHIRRFQRLLLSNGYA